jgi:hypothetical protein
MPGSSPDGTEAFRRAAQTLNEAGDKDLRREVYAALRRAAKPLGDKVIAEGSSGLPGRGGLRARVAAAKFGQSNATTGRNPGVSLRFRTTQGYDLAAMDRGQLRHPVFARAGQPRTWVRQSIRAKLFTTPFEAGVEPVRKEIVAAMEAVAQDIAAKTSRGPHV